jgi:hypothetical protein
LTRCVKGGTPFGSDGWIPGFRRRNTALITNDLDNPSVPMILSKADAVALGSQGVRASSITGWSRLDIDKAIGVDDPHSSSLAATTAANLSE